MVVLRNYDRNGHGTVTAYDALRQSFNTALKTWQQVNSQAGDNAVKKFASKVGLDYQSDIGPSDVLGGSASEFLTYSISICFRSNC